MSSVIPPWTSWRHVKSSIPVVVVGTAGTVTPEDSKSSLVVFFSTASQELVALGEKDFVAQFVRVPPEAHP